MNPADPPVITVESVSLLDKAKDYGVIICGSHGGHAAAAMLSVSARSVRAAIFNDAGIGLDSAGISSLPWLEQRGIAAATVAHTSARIGDGDDMAARGIISQANSFASHLGVKPGMSCAEAATLLSAAPSRYLVPDHSHRAGRALVCKRPIPVWCLDSASLVRESDAGAIVLTGSHGGLLGGRTESAVKSAVFAAFYNDADVGIDGAGLSRLPALDAMNIVGVTVSAASARIGDGHSTYDHGVISALNATATAHGGQVGESARAFVDRMLAQQKKVC